MSHESTQKAIYLRLMAGDGKAADDLLMHWVNGGLLHKACESRAAKATKKRGLEEDELLSIAFIKLRGIAQGLSARVPPIEPDKLTAYVAKTIEEEFRRSRAAVAVFGPSERTRRRLRTGDPNAKQILAKLRKFRGRSLTIIETLVARELIESLRAIHGRLGLEIERISGFLIGVEDATFLVGARKSVPKKQKLTDAVLSRSTHDARDIGDAIDDARQLCSSAIESQLVDKSRIGMSQSEIAEALGVAQHDIASRGAIGTPRGKSRRSKRVKHGQRSGRAR